MAFCNFVLEHEWERVGGSTEDERGVELPLLVMRIDECLNRAKFAAHDIAVRQDWGCCL